MVRIGRLAKTAEKARKERLAKGAGVVKTFIMANLAREAEMTKMVLQAKKA